jgi:predicted nucleic acid-binding protein
LAVAFLAAAGPAGRSSGGTVRLWVTNDWNSPDDLAVVTRYGIDAPTLLHIVAQDIQIDVHHQIVAPNVIRSDALAMLFGAVQREELTEDVALHQLERATELKMRLLGDRVSRRTAWKIARAHGWVSTHEAEYLAVAQLQADALVTIDPELAAKSQGVVALAPLDALTAGET